MLVGWIKENCAGCTRWGAMKKSFCASYKTLIAAHSVPRQPKEARDATRYQRSKLSQRKLNSARHRDGSSNQKWIWQASIIRIQSRGVTHQILVTKVKEVTKVTKCHDGLMFASLFRQLSRSHGFYFGSAVLTARGSGFRVEHAI